MLKSIRPAQGATAASAVGDRAVSADALRRFVSFLLAGGLAACANIGSRIVFSLWVRYEIAIVLGYAVGISVAFALNRRFVFDPSNRSLHEQCVRFFAVNLVSFTQVWLVTMLLARIVFPAAGFDWHTETVAHVIGVLSPAVTSYWLHKHFSFASTKAAPRVAA